ncbi:MAG: fused MFS/spermidine synthase [Acidobacteria bacterium]|nr:fused MFS/spermidine synthase [Acidobacteriota bacterium]
MTTREGGPATGEAEAGGVALRRVAMALFFLSGAAGLVYEVVWLRLLVLVFGSAHFAVTAVLTAFMAGIGLGALIVGRRVDRTNWHPLALYGVLEIGIGVSALAVPPLIDGIRPLVASLPIAVGTTFYVGSLVRFLLSLVVLIVPTMLLGGTLPVLGRLVRDAEGGAGRGVATLYAVNVAGAVLGVLATGFVLLPLAGAALTGAAAAAANVALGVAALAASRVWRLEASAAERGAPHAPDPGPFPRLVVGAAGAIAMTYEVAWSRLLGLVLGSSVYAFTVMLATFLAGLAAGAALGSRWAAEGAEPRAALRRLGAVIAGGAAAGYVTLHVLPALPAAYAAAFHGLGLADGDAVLAGRVVRLAALEFAVAGVAMLPAAICAGMVFPLTLGIVVNDPRRVGRTVGALSAASTAGTIAGAVFAGIVLLPTAGLQGSLLAAVGAGLLLAAVVRGRGERRPAGRRWLAAVGVGALVAVLVAARPPWEPLVMNSGVFQYAPELGAAARTRDGFRAAQRDDAEVLFYEEGLTANVLVARQPSTDNVWLSIDGKIDASSRSDLATQLLLGHLPMVWRGARAQGAAGAAVIGYASGITTGAVTRHAPSRVAAVEIEPAVIRASFLFNDVNHAPLDDPAVRLVESDGRTFLAADGDPYDVIVSEPSNPWMTMAANLFTREFFEAGRGRLAPGGVFSQWIQLYGMRPEDLRSLVATFAAAFPRVAMFWGIPGRDLVLLGSDAALGVDVDRVEAALSRAPVAADLARIDIRGVEDLLAFHLTDDAGARAFAAGAPLNTDDNGRIEFRAPRSLHADTRSANVAALTPFAVDPLAGAANLEVDAERRAERYVALGRAFYRRGMYGRAVAALREAESLRPTETGALRLESYERVLQEEGPLR